MYEWTIESVIYVGCLVFAGLCLAWAATFGLRALLRENSPIKQPGDSPEPPDEESPRRRPRVVLGGQGYPSTTLASRRAS